MDVLNNHYYVTQKGREVDFIAHAPESGTACLIQVCWSMADPETRLREGMALAEAMQEKKVKRGLIITAFDERYADLPVGVKTVAAWRWLQSADPFFMAE